MSKILNSTVRAISRPIVPWAKLRAAYIARSTLPCLFSNIDCLRMWIVHWRQRHLFWWDLLPYATAYKSSPAHVLKFVDLLGSLTSGLSHQHTINKPCVHRQYVHLFLYLDTKGGLQEINWKDSGLTLRPAGPRSTWLKLCCILLLVGTDLSYKTFRDTILQ